MNESSLIIVHFGSDKFISPVHLVNTAFISRINGIVTDARLEQSLNA